MRYLWDPVKINRDELIIKLNPQSNESIQGKRNQWIYRTSVSRSSPKIDFVVVEKSNLKWTHAHTAEMYIWILDVDPNSPTTVMVHRYPTTCFVDWRDSESKDKTFYSYRCKRSIPSTLLVFENGWCERITDYTFTVRGEYEAERSQTTLERIPLK